MTAQKTLDAMSCTMGETNDQLLTMKKWYNHWKLNFILKLNFIVQWQQNAPNLHLENKIFAAI